MKQIQINKIIVGIKEDYRTIIKSNYFKTIKKDVEKVDEFTTQFEQNDNETIKIQKISINKTMLDNFKSFVANFCDNDTQNAVDKASNNQLKKAYSLAIFDNTKTRLKIKLRTKTETLKDYQDVTRVYQTIKETIENVKTACKKLAILTSEITNTIKFVNLDEIYQKMLDKKAGEKKQAKLAKSNAKAKANEKAKAKASKQANK